jgi:hypothetical protein
MTDDDRRWVWQRLEEFASMLGEEVAKTENEIVRKLREEMGLLRNEIEALKKASKPDVSLKGVVPLRDRNVA